MAEKERMTIYPSPELKARVEAIAEREHRSANAQVLLWLEEIVNREEGTLPLPLGLRSIAVVGDKHVDMLTGKEVDPFTLEPVPGAEADEIVPVVKTLKRVRGPRSETCPHRLAPNQFCKECDS